MPGRNRQGPMGQGPKTGRGAGYCGDRDESRMSAAPGRGGRGMRRGRRAGAAGGEDLLRARIAELEEKIARMEQKD
jgi:hypothetical protein